MTLEMDQFHDGFFTECRESLDAMEAALLQLDPGSPNAESINSIFRVAHSVKGGSGMFGFSEITSFTHTLETLLDELRNGRQPVTASVIDLLLKSTDVLRGMLQATQNKSAIDMQAVADLQFDLEQLVVLGARAAAATPAKDTSEAPRPQASQDLANDPEPEGARWAISFRPNARLLLQGNDPIRIIAELQELGQMTRQIDAAAVPPLGELDPEVCYFTWRFELVTPVPEDIIRSVFDWAEGDCDLAIAPISSTQLDAAGETRSATATAVHAPAASTAAPTPAASHAAVPRVIPDAPGRTEPAAEAPAKPVPVEANSIRVSIEKIDELMNTVGEIVITQSMLMQFTLGTEAPRLDMLRAGLTQLERNVRELQESVMRVRMLPISFTFSRFPRLVRDLSLRLNKKIELKMTGEGTELDKTVLEKIGDPLVHLVRNSIDHGIESPQVRLAAGKPEVGTVFLNAFHRGGMIVVEVGDDGAGLNRDRIIAKARANGLIGLHETPGEDEVAELIFMPGFSTAEQATDLSGRGVGMDVVRRNVKELGGTVELQSKQGVGSRFTISLPLTLAIVDGQTIAVGNETYIVPLVAIVESLQIKAHMVSELVGRGEVFSFRGDYVPIIRLHRIFGVEPRYQSLEQGLVMVVEGDGRKVGLFVDELLGQQQVVIKSMETNYRRVEGVSGATILGEGSVALILDVPGLVRCAAEKLAA